MLAERAGFSRCALHSRSFIFTDPFDMRENVICAEIPDDMALVMKNNDLHL
jgi:hypothetical protein